VAARGRIKRRHERSPLLGIQTDAIAFRQYLVRRGEGAVDDELADRRVALARSFLQDALGFRRNANIELIRTLCRVWHSSLREVFPNIAGCTDNDQTIPCDWGSPTVRARILNH